MKRIIFIIFFCFYNSLSLSFASDLSDAVALYNQVLQMITEAQDLEAPVIALADCYKTKLQQFEILAQSDPCLLGCLNSLTNLLNAMQNSKNVIKTDVDLLFGIKSVMSTILAAMYENERLHQPEENADLLHDMLDSFNVATAIMEQLEDAVDTFLEAQNLFDTILDLARNGCYDFGVLPC